MLKGAREYLSLSQDEVAKAVGYPAQPSRLIESGQRRVDALELKKFATHLSTSCQYLFTGDEKR